MKAVTTSRWIYPFLWFLGVVAAAAVLAAVTVLTTPRMVFIMSLFLVSTVALMWSLAFLAYHAWKAFVWIVRQISTRDSVPVQAKTTSPPIAFRSSGPQK